MYRNRTTLCRKKCCVKAASCVWIAASRCSPNKSKLREQTPPEFFDGNWSILLLVGNHLLIQFHQFGHTGALAGAGGSTLGKAVSVHHSAVVVLVGFAQFRRHGQFIVQVSQTAIRIKCACVQNSLCSLLDFVK